MKVYWKKREKGSEKEGGQRLVPGGKSGGREGEREGKRGGKRERGREREGQGQAHLLKGNKGT